MTLPRSVTVLAGGVGGAKLAQGVCDVVDDVTVVINTADDVELHGLWISPDVDTVTYTLAGIANPATGWGIEGETFTVLETLGRLGADTWFALGDRDLATHIHRTARLRAGEPLSAITQDVARALGVPARLLPVTDDRVATVVDTPAGRLAFQDYFVRRRHADEVLAVTVEGIADARPAPGVLEAVTGADVVVLAPSNPFLSIAPVLDVPGVREALAGSSARRVAVSPIIAGAAVKGPAASLLASLGHEVSALGVARLYVGLVDVMCIDERDAGLADDVAALGFEVHVTSTLMAGRDDRARLAREVLETAVG